MKLFNLSLFLAVAVATMVVGCGSNNSTPYSTVASGLGRTACLNGVGGALGAAGGQCYGTYYNAVTGQVVPGFGPCTPGIGTPAVGGAYPYATPGAYPYATPGIPGACTCNAGFYPNLSNNSCIPTNQCPSTNVTSGITVCNVQ